MTIRVTVWHEHRHEKAQNATGAKVREIYPRGIHGAIAAFLGKETDFSVRTATLDEPEHGLTQEVVDQTDVMLWWGHCAHGDVKDEIVDRVQQRVLAGMGLLVLHSGHYAKIFKRLMGTNCSLLWREAGEKERLWVLEPSHPIAQGLGPYFELPQTEMYGERFDIPTPDELVFVSWFAGGEIFRSGCCWRRGNGKVFYFRPGHETYPIYHDANVQRVIVNAVRWAAPTINQMTDKAPNSKPLEDLAKK